MIEFSNASTALFFVVTENHTIIFGLERWSIKLNLSTRTLYTNRGARTILAD